MSAAPPDDDQLPRAIATPRRRRSAYAVWLIPLVAALIGLTLAVRSFLASGPTISIVFKTAEGLEAGKTKIKYKNVDIGDVRSVTLSEEGEGVVVTAEMAKAADKLLVEDTRFWVERARFAGGGLTGISTLLSGAYIGIDAGKSADGRRNFTGLDTPPSVTTDEPGREFVLRATDLGSIDIGSPVYFRRVPVGKVTATQLDADGGGVTLRVFVAAPNEKLVTENTRFWHASGLDVNVDAGGIKLQTQSVLSILLGGIAFATPEALAAQPKEAAAGRSFRLFDNQAVAMKRSDAEVTNLVAYFSDSLRGLEPGAQVDFRGVVVGEVTAIDIEYDRDRREFRFPVSFVLYRDRVRSKVSAALQRAQVDPTALLERSIDRGLRAQLRTGNLLSGQRYVALDFFKNAPAFKQAAAEGSGAPIEMPTMPGSLEDLQASITNIAKRIESLPLEELVAEVRRTMRGLETTLASTDRLVRSLDTQVGELVPEVRSAVGEARRTMRSAGELLADDAPTPQALRESLRELGRAAQSLRELTDYLQRHPESLLRGKPADAAAPTGDQR
ncbi:MAG TPA: MlaD family protein [Methylibium sp.]|uniref:PqiB family protein n=1 Tax=Methylibium sp. TaxID=2067992 RepID=UPI002DBFD65D|nr:MlaD family protein [Methylibium sp.]HEU4458687.1 MlaD family protein [Methylibium sp.]